VLRGGTFIRPGEEVAAIAFDLVSVPHTGDTLRAEAEFLGGPRGGLVQLYDVEIGE